jgi:hypothetical protein
MAMQRMNQAMSTLSNIMKKRSDTAKGIIHNLR